MIEIFSTETCPRCKILKEKMEDKGVDFVENRDIEEMEKLGIMSVPVLRKDGELLDFGKAISWINSL